MNLVCPVCGAEYLGWVSRCSDCGVAVVPPSEAPNPLELPEDEQVIYELGDWSLDMQADAAAAMAESGIPHAFDGPDLVVHVDYEADVDHILDRVEHGGEAAHLAHLAESHHIGDDRNGSPGGDVVYELDEWDEESREELQRRLAIGSVPFRVEGTSVVIDAGDEEAVDFLVAEVRGTEADPDEPLVDEPDPEVLGRIFVTADRIHDRPTDAEALVDMLDLADEIDDEHPPYGVAPAAWEQIVASVDALADAITGDHGDDDDSDDDDDDDDGGSDRGDDVSDDDEGGDDNGDDYALDDDDAVEETDANASTSSGAASPARAKSLAGDLRVMLRPYV